MPTNPNHEPSLFDLGPDTWSESPADPLKAGVGLYAMQVALDLAREMSWLTFLLITLLAFIATIFVKSQASLRKEIVLARQAVAATKDELDKYKALSEEKCEAPLVLDQGVTMLITDDRAFVSALDGERQIRVAVPKHDIALGLVRASMAEPTSVIANRPQVSTTPNPQVVPTESVDIGKEVLLPRPVFSSTTWPTCVMAVSATDQLNGGFQGMAFRFNDTVCMPVHVYEQLPEVFWLFRQKKACPIRKSAVVFEFFSSQHQGDFVSFAVFSKTNNNSPSGRTDVTSALLSSIGVRMAQCTHPDDAPFSLVFYDVEKKKIRRSSGNSIKCSPGSAVRYFHDASTFKGCSGAVLFQGKFVVLMHSGGEPSDSRCFPGYINYAVALPQLFPVSADPLLLEILGSLEDAYNSIVDDEKSIGKEARKNWAHYHSAKLANYNLAQKYWNRLEDDFAAEHESYDNYVYRDLEDDMYSRMDARAEEKGTLLSINVASNGDIYEDDFRAENTDYVTYNEGKLPSLTRGELQNLWDMAQSTDWSDATIAEEELAAYYGPNWMDYMMEEFSPDYGLSDYLESVTKLRQGGIKVTRQGSVRNKQLEYLTPPADSARARLLKILEARKKAAAEAPPKVETKRKRKKRNRKKRTPVPPPATVSGDSKDPPGKEGRSKFFTPEATSVARMACYTMKPPALKDGKKRIVLPSEVETITYVSLRSRDKRKEEHPFMAHNFPELTMPPGTSESIVNAFLRNLERRIEKDPVVPADAIGEFQATMDALYPFRINHDLFEFGDAKRPDNAWRKAIALALHRELGQIDKSSGNINRAGKTNLPYCGNDFNMTNNDVLANHRTEFIYRFLEWVEYLLTLDPDELRKKTPLQLMKEGVVFPIVVGDKSEFHPKRKADSGRWRIIMMVGLVAQMLERLVYGPLVAHHKNEKEKCPSASGYGYNTDAERNEFSGVIFGYAEDAANSGLSHMISSDDCSGFDFHVPSAALKCATRSCAEQMGGHPNLTKLLELIDIMHVEKPVLLLPDGRVIADHKGTVLSMQKSGRYVTTFTNCMIRATYGRFAHDRAVAELKLSKSYYKSKANGDDHVAVVGLPPETEWKSYSTLVKSVYEEVLKQRLREQNHSQEGFGFCSLKFSLHHPTYTTSLAKMTANYVKRMFDKTSGLQPNDCEAKAFEYLIRNAPEADKYSAIVSNAWKELDILDEPKFSFFLNDDDEMMFDE